MKKRALFLSAVFFAAFVTSCSTTHTVKVEPMHITIDVNVRIDKALDDFFGDIDSAADTSSDTSDTSGDASTAQ